MLILCKAVLNNGRTYGADRIQMQSQYPRTSPPNDDVKMIVSFEGISILNLCIKLV